ncbi:hypothetical protein LINGRAHAP2_LOCUS8106 [Linum grandiflorum]
MRKKAATVFRLRLRLLFGTSSRTTSSWTWASRASRSRGITAKKATISFGSGWTGLFLMLRGGMLMTKLLFFMRGI